VRAGARAKRKEKVLTFFLAILFRRQFMMPSDVYTKRWGEGGECRNRYLLWRQFQHFYFYFQKIPKREVTD
jgi:hypothetical protein